MSSSKQKPLNEYIDFIDEPSSFSSNSDTSYSNKLAKEEDENWDKQRKDIDGANGLRLEKVFFNIAIIIVSLLTFLLCILLVIWFFHLVAPECWKWLNKSDVQSIERILFASTLLSLAGKYFSKYKILNSH